MCRNIMLSLLCLKTEIFPHLRLLVKYKKESYDDLCCTDPLVLDGVGTKALTLTMLRWNSMHLCHLV